MKEEAWRRAVAERCRRGRSGETQEGAEEGLDALRDDSHCCAAGVFEVGCFLVIGVIEGGVELVAKMLDLRHWCSPRQMSMFWC